MKQEEIVVDFREMRKLSETWNPRFYPAQFGIQIQNLLNMMLGGNRGFLSGLVKIKGSKSDIKAFAKTLAGEKRYYKAYKKFGLDNAKTFRTKAQLDRAIKNFERVTGIKYPLK
tara:strand:- start:459 stop:800 length:342 start_codon:yes stop_codon:yes gene_type:complete